VLVLEAEHVAQLVAEDTDAVEAEVGGAVREVDRHASAGRRIGREERRGDELPRRRRRSAR
jgi:hypothetical protein